MGEEDELDKEFRASAFARQTEPERIERKRRQPMPLSRPVTATGEVAPAFSTGEVAPAFSDEDDVAPEMQDLLAIQSQEINVIAYNIGLLTALLTAAVAAATCGFRRSCNMPGGKSEFLVEGDSEYREVPGDAAILATERLIACGI